MDRDSASVKKEWANAKVPNASVWWSHGNSDKKVRALENVVGVAFEAVAESEQQNASKVAHSVKAAFSEHWERLP